MVKCNHPGCKIRPSFNNPGEKKGMFCGEHKKKGMVNVINATCNHPGCNKQPKFNNPGEKKGMFCGEHKKKGMVDVISPRCNHPGCNKKPSFNNPGEKKGMFCAEHKKKGMVDVISPRCNHPGCNKKPSFNNPGEKKGMFCAEHKREGMVDVINATCNHPGCNKQPKFNNPGEKKGMFCGEHKKKGMVDVINPRCNNEWCDTLVTKKYKGYCLYCFVNMFPEEPITRNYKTKELAVLKFIKSEFPNIDIASDKKILGGCSKKRPDILVDLGYQVVIIEIDENQHIDYDCSCENKRLMELSRDVGHRPIVFIRFNPDGYIQNEKTITSCWGIDGNGFATVKNNKKKEWIQRLDLLKTTFEYWIDGTNITDKTIETIQLYYDK